jgi:hypothetical protein
MSDPKLKPLVNVAIPITTPSKIVEFVKNCVLKSYPHIEIQYISKEEISLPMAFSFECKDVDLGSINGDRDEPSIAIINGIQLEVDRAFRQASLEQ